MDPETLSLLRYFADNRTRLFKEHRLYILVIWVGGTKTQASQLVKEKDLGGVNLGVAAAGDKSLERWRIAPRAKNTLVFINMGRTKTTLTNFRAKDLEGLEARLGKLLGKPQ